MKKILILSLLFAHFSTFAFDDGSDKIIKKYLKAIGGAKEWEAIKTIKTTLQKEDKYLGESITTISILRDKGYKREKVYEFSNDGTKTFQGGTPSVYAWYNDEIAWSVANFSVNVGDKKADSTLNLIQKQYGFNQVIDISNDKHWIQSLKWQTQMPWCFIDYETKGYKTIYRGDSKISVDEVSEIEMISPQSDTIHYFFRKKNNLLLKFAYKKREFVYSNYKQVENVKVPFEITEILIDSKVGGSYSEWYTINQVKFNEPMGEKIFLKPKQ